MWDVSWHIDEVASDTLIFEVKATGSKHLWVGIGFHIPYSSFTDLIVSSGNEMIDLYAPLTNRMEAESFPLAYVDEAGGRLNSSCSIEGVIRTCTFSRKIISSDRHDALLNNDVEIVYVQGSTDYTPLPVDINRNAATTWRQFSTNIRGESLRWQ